MTDFAAARHNMVEGQIRTNKVTNPQLLAALGEIPREQFLPVERRAAAYVDEDVRIAADRYLIEPMVLSRLLEVAQVGKTDVALDIGCGPGYSTAVLARLAGTVVGLESDPALARQASDLMTRLASDAAIIVEGPLRQGYPKHAPYDVIVIGGAVAEIPPAIFDQMAEGGRLVTVRRPPGGVGEGVLMLKRHGAVSSRGVFDAATPYLIGFAPAPRFVF